MKLPSNADSPEDLRNDGDEQPFNWTDLIPVMVHPVRVAILETMAWTRCELSATDMRKVIAEDISVSNLSYHFNFLAKPKAQVIELVKTESVGGSLERFYYFRGMVPGR